MLNSNHNVHKGPTVADNNRQGNAMEIIHTSYLWKENHNQGTSDCEINTN